MKRVIIIAGALAIVVIAAVALRPQPLLVNMTEVSTRTVKQYVSEDAETRLADTYLIDMPVSGTVERIQLDIGDRVEQGQVVARVDPFDLEQQIREMDAAIAQARARIQGVDTSKPKPEDIDDADVKVQEMKDGLAIAQKERSIAAIEQADTKRDYDRLVQLRKDGVVSQAQFDTAERRYKAANENLKRAGLAEQAAKKTLERAGLALQRISGSVDDNEYLRDVYLAEIESLEARKKIVQNDLAKTTITAPVTGLVLAKSVEDRRVLLSGSPLLELGDLATIEIESDILSEEVVSINVDDPVEITGKALGGETTTGAVKRIYPSGFEKISALGIEQQRVKILVDFDNSQLRLRPGTSVDIRVITAENTDTLAVPERATFRHEGQWAVFLVHDGHAKLTPVKVGLRNDDWAEILEGVQAGDTLVAEPKNELDDGMRVAPL